MRYRVDGVDIEQDTPSGEIVRGEGGVLLFEDDDLTRDTQWHADGFTVAEFLAADVRARLRDGLARLIRQVVADVHGRNVESFALAGYHLHCGGNAGHAAIVRRLQELSPLDNFPLDHRVVDNWVSRQLGMPASCRVASREAAGRFFVRIVRPGSPYDNNPPHRDVWLDRLRDAINLYAPLAGSNGKSSLPLMPGSHLWPECDVYRTRSGARIHDHAYTVPAALRCRQGMDMTRPHVGEDEAMLFSPYLIHGGAANLNSDITRISLEMRFWRAD